VASDARGSAMMEFALVLPVILFFALLLAQATVVLGANLHVHYAAFAAARCAIVQIPCDYSTTTGEGVNTIVNSAASAAGVGSKLELIRRAAVYALVSVSGPDNAEGRDGVISSAPYAQALASLYTSYGQTAPSWVNNVIPGRVRYADANTNVALVNVATVNGAVILTPLADQDGKPDGSIQIYGPVDPVAVQVTHKLNLALPYVNKLIFMGVGGGQQAAMVNGKQYSLTYCTLTAQSMLTNQGVPTALPPATSVPRQP
jgi:Flp pilus assembly protein TadG